jgi:hypothetical protein
MRKEGAHRLEVARRFNLSLSRIDQIEMTDMADRATAERRAQLREAIRSADDLDKMWPVIDLLDAVRGVGKKGFWCVVNGLDRPLSREELQERVGLRDRENFRKLYLLPALESGLVERTIPDKPNSRLQKYRLTKAGADWLKAHSKR